MAGALGRYLQDRGDSLADVEIRALVPISLRPAGTEEELGNRIGIVLLPLPVEVADPAARLCAIKRRMDEYKGSLEAPIIYGAMMAFGRAPGALINPLVDYLCARATVAVTNVKGPQEQLYLAGAPLESFMFWIPRYGGIGLGVSILSYAGKVVVGVISDENVVADPETVVAGFCAEFEAMLALAREARETPSLQDLSTRLDDALGAVDEMLAAGTEAQPPAPEPAPDRCQALTKAGRPCKNRPLPGSTHCRVHQ
jgi:WS/DGAT/MGAT family acyltransferase